ncbi:MAG: hypothetical protein K2X94_01030 [Amoebophilaceae bacterium]|nr:hypothetical protein [Amoebophilaceae bacterium]
MRKNTFYIPAYGYVIVWLFAITPSLASKSTFKPTIVKAAKQSMVSIEVSTSLTAYTFPVTTSDLSGVLVNKAKGYILTISYGIGPVAVGAYHITFYNGQQTKATLRYYDPWCCYAILQVDPAAIPEAATQAIFSQKDPAIEAPVFTFSKGKNNQYMIHEGTITACQVVDLPMPQQAFGVSMDTKGSEIHGALIWNTKGEAVGLNIDGSKTAISCLDGSYISYALSFLNEGTIPVRKHIGALCGDYSLTEAVKYDQFPVEKQKEYDANFPIAQHKILQVKATLHGSPAAGLLIPGDIVWAIDGRSVARLIDLDMAMNTSTKAACCLTIFRKGRFEHVNISLYSPEAHKVRRIVQFGGATFFELDDVSSRLVGVPASHVTFGAAGSNNIFRPNVYALTANEKIYFFCLKLLTVDDQPVATLDDIIRLIPKLIEKKYFNIQYVNHLPVQFALNFLLLGQDTYKANITYDEHSPEPRLFTWDPIQLAWNSDPIPLVPGATY